MPRLLPYIAAGLISRGGQHPRVRAEEERKHGASERADSPAVGGREAVCRVQSSRRGYQFVDNYFVRVLGGRAAWELPPGAVGATKLAAARIALGKFEVILRQACLATDLALLTPYLNDDDGDNNMADADVDDEAPASDASSGTSVNSDNEP